MSRRYLTDAAKLIDSRSARSRQRKVGASEIGVCRRRAGYVHHRTEVSNPENVTGLAAVVGTWIHKGALDSMRRAWGTVIETRVEDDLLRGHVDGIDLPNPIRVRVGLPEHPLAPDVVEVDDLKTKRDARAVGFVRNRGPKRSELYQVHLYAGLLRRGMVAPLKRQAALADVGPLDVQTIRLRYFPRTGEEDAEYPHEQPFDPEIEAEAWSWVEQVARSERPEVLPRDEDGPGLSVICDNCPFRSACWDESTDHRPQAQLVVTDADLAKVLATYDLGRTDEQDGKRRKDAARAALDATTSAIYTDGRALSFKVGWGGGNPGKAKVDNDLLLERFEQMRAEFKAAGIPAPEVPYLEETTTPRVLSVTRWDLPDTECGKPVGAPTAWADGDGGLWIQDRPRGGWTNVDVDETLTAGQFAKRFPGYVEPRPPCVLKKAHSGDCRDASFVVELDVDPEDT